MNLLHTISVWWKNFLRKRRLSVFDAASDREEWHLHLSPAGLCTALVAALLLLFILSISVVAYTPVLEFLPGYRLKASESRTALARNILRLDSMERMMRDMMTYNENIALIMEGKTPIVRTLTSSDSTRTSKTLVVPIAEDSVLRSEMEGEGAYALARTATPARPGIEMVPPLDGVIIDRFGIKQGNFGIRIAASPDAQVAAVADGTVVMSLWTPQTGYLIGIQHAGNLLSIYRNLSHSLVTAGQRITRGEAIGSNTESLTDGGDAKIFEFELWNNQKPVDPESYIVF